MIRTPDQWWMPREYSYHYTGEVDQYAYFARLNGIDRSYLAKLLNHIKLVGQALRTPFFRLVLALAQTSHGPNIVISTYLFVHKIQKLELILYSLFINA